MKNKPDVILKIEDKPVVEEMTEFLRTLSVREQERMEDIMKGIKIGIALGEEKTKSA